MKLNKLPILFGSLCLALAIAGCSKSDTSSEAVAAPPAAKSSNWRSL
jgi:hypothetical protein